MNRKGVSVLASVFLPFLCVGILLVGVWAYYGAFRLPFLHASLDQERKRIEYLEQNIAHMKASNAEEAGNLVQLERWRFQGVRDS